MSGAGISDDPQVNAHGFPEEDADEDKHDDYVTGVRDVIFVTV